MNLLKLSGYLLFPRYKTKLQNRITHYDVTNRVSTSKILYLCFFELVTRCKKNFNIIFELVTRDFFKKQNFRVTNLKK